MIRIGLGENWKQNPAYVRPLRALARGQARGFSPRHIVDVVRIEVDGVDLTEGAGEGALLDILISLGHAAREIARPDGHARLVLGPPGIELEIRRIGSDVELCLRSASKGWKGVRTIVVPASRFARAVHDASKAFLEDLKGIHPALIELRIFRDLARGGGTAGGIRSGGARATTPAHEAVSGPLTLALKGNPPGVVVLDPEGIPRWSAPRVSDTLLTLVRLLGGEELTLAGVAVDRALGTIQFGRGRAVSFVVARSLIAELCEKADSELPPDTVERIRTLLRAVGPRKARTPAPKLRAAAESESETSSAEAPGAGLRRLLFRRAWRIEARGPRPSLTRFGDRLLVGTSSHVELFSNAGEPIWHAPLLEGRLVRAGREHVVLGRTAGGQATVLEAATGERRARLDAGLHSHLRTVQGLDDGSVALGDGTRIVGFGADGARPWTFEPGHGAGILVTSGGPALLVATDGGYVYRLDRGGDALWCARTRQDPVQALLLDTARERVFSIGLDENGYTSIAAVRISDGDVLWAAELHGIRPAAALCQDVLWVGLDTPAGPSLALLNGTTGQLIWQRSCPGDGAVAPVAFDQRICVSRIGGGLASFFPDGRLERHVPPLDTDVTLSPARPRAPILLQDLAILPAARVHVVDLRSGRQVAALEPAELAPETVVALDRSLLATTTRDGTVETWRLRGHLRVIAGDHEGSIA